MGIIVKNMIAADPGVGFKFDIPGNVNIDQALVVAVTVVEPQYTDGSGTVILRKTHNFSFTISPPLVIGDTLIFVLPYCSNTYEGETSVNVTIEVSQGGTAITIDSINGNPTANNSFTANANKIFNLDLGPNATYRTIGAGNQGNVLVLDRDTGHIISGPIDPSDENLSLWRFVPVVDGYYKIVSKETNKVFDLFKPDLDFVNQFDAYEDLEEGHHNNQLWKIEQAGNGNCSIISKWNLKALEIIPEGRLMVGERNSSENQLFKI